MKAYDSNHIDIDLAGQNLSLFSSNSESWLLTEQRWLNNINLKPKFTCKISSAKNGVGQLNGSFQTPAGKHNIRAKIGQGAKLNSVFVGRRLTGETWDMKLHNCYPERDWILTRILWLCGLESGFNRFGNIDTMKRYIYIHGSPPIVSMGKIGSKGCIRMPGKNIIELFDLINIGTTVNLRHHYHFLQE